MACLLVCATALGGCYYSHVARGQLALLWDRRPAAEVLADPATPRELRERLELVEQVRSFARSLGLAVDDHYRSFVERPGRALVTTVVATRPGEIEPAGFWFPVVGRVPYKGFFDPEPAAREAARLRERGLDVCVSPIVAYSTLGWFDDPLTGPMLRLEAGRLVETLLHELVHATIYVESDATFNEGLANFVGQEAAVRFAAAAHGPEAARSERSRVEEDRAVAALLAGFRSAVAALYAESSPGPARVAQRAALTARTREALAALPLTTRGGAEWARSVRLNDACQALMGAYDTDLPRHVARLEALGDDLSAFLAAAREAEQAEDPRATLLGPEPATPSPDSSAGAMDSSVDLRWNGSSRSGPGTGPA